MPSRLEPVDLGGEEEGHGAGWYHRCGVICSVRSTAKVGLGCVV